VTPPAGRRRVVITGIGVISVLGCTVQEFWDALLAGRSGIGKVTQFDATGLPCQIAGEARSFDPNNYFEEKESRRMPRSTQMALAAAINAVSDAGLPTPLPEPERSGVVFGTAIGGVERIDEGINTIRTQSYRKLNPFVLPAGLPNFPAFMISKEFRCHGPNSTITTACATGTQAIGDAAEIIRRGAADVMICGGTESFIKDFALGGFAAMRALPTSFNDSPERASRPFDAKREGFVISEGAATLVLESLDHALARGAHIYAEVAGHASSSDAYHMAAPDPAAEGPARTMRWALDDSGLTTADVDYINAHGTSTDLNDSTETRAIKAVFGEGAYKVPISSTKSMLGHAMGASGALEAVICALVMRDNIIPPTINYENPDPELDLDYTPNKARQLPVKVTLSNSFGLGGQNACLVLKAFEE
jgi:3-oxoacyl-[acyl-carrier-protein] synthase II